MWSWITVISICMLTSGVQMSDHHNYRSSHSQQSGSNRIVGKVNTPLITEASGLAASRKHPGILYTHNDHGDSPRIFALNSTDASLVATFPISGADNHDWEDLAVGPCENKICIFIADTGNGDHYARNMIYKIEEPDTLRDGQKLPVISTLRFRWSESESETLLVDTDGELYVIGRVYHGRGMIAHLPRSAWDVSTPVDVSSNNFLSLSTHHHDPVGGDISPDGSAILIKAKTHIYFWPITYGIIQSLTKSPTTELPYIMENIGQALCWSWDGRSYYTLGEGHHQPLYEYNIDPQGSNILG